MSNHVRYLQGTRIAKRAQFLTPDEAARIVAIAERAGAASSWGVADDYAQATVDLEVDRVPELRAYLLGGRADVAVCRVGGVDLVARLQAHYRAAHGAAIAAFDDLFVVKYDVASGGQCELVLHTDAGDLSFMVALSAADGYAGGGTFFKSLGETVHLELGEILTFSAPGAFHKGVPLTRGKRYLLVGFCLLDPVQATASGNLDLTLSMIP